MTEKFNIQAYLSHGIEKIVAASLKATLRDPDVFIMKKESK